MFVYQRVRCFFFFNRLCDHTPLVSVIAGEPCLFPVVSPQSTQLITASWVYTKLARRTGNKWLLGPKSEFLTFVLLVSTFCQWIRGYWMNYSHELRVKLSTLWSFTLWELDNLPWTVRQCMNLWRFSRAKMVIIHTGWGHPGISWFINHYNPH